MRRPLFLLAWLWFSVPLLAPEIALSADESSLAGKWTYRSFHNNPAPVDGDADKALGLL